METIILNWETATENCDVSDFLNNQLKTDDILTLFEGDPDILHLQGEKVLFVDFIHNQTRFVIYLDGSYKVNESDIIEYLKRFYSDDLESNFEHFETDWDGFTDDMIAYRGGKGYFYTIWKSIA